MKTKYYMPSFCLEELSVFPDEYMKMAYAVVCFADLLQEEVQQHMNRFHSDSYLKMSKEWAITNKVSPVIYYTDNSNMASYLKNVILDATEKFVQKERGKYISHEKLKYINSVQMIMAYLKQYEGRYLIKDRNIFSEKINFYVEREWRYVPMPQNYEAFYLDEKEFYDKNLRDSKQDELVKNGYALKFNWIDIEEIGIPISNQDSFISLLHRFWKLTQVQVMEKIHLLP